MTFPLDWSTKIHFMSPLFGAVLCKTTDPEKKLIQAWIEVHGISCVEVNPKNWKDYPNGIKLFIKPSPELAKELLEWSIEPLLIGDFSATELESYKKTGVSFYFNDSILKISELPVFPATEQKLKFIIYTKDPLFDHQIQSIIKSMGQEFFVEGRFEELVHKMKFINNYILILDWDKIPTPIFKIVETFEELKKTRSFLLLGLKDFLKDNLYQDLKSGISGISNVLIQKEELIPTLLSSFPIQNEKNGKEIQKETKRFKIEFQEKKIPIRISLDETFFENRIEPNDKTKQILNLFNWL